jgi:glycosyltransferase involved in cell wall biosynthesis
MKNLPKVLVACPTYSGMSYCLEKFIERIKNLNYPNYDILLIDNSEDDDYFNKISSIDKIAVLKDKTIEKNPRKKIVDSRNKIIDYALQNKYDYILMMDQDVIPPKEIITELLKDNQNLVSGLYFNYFTSSGKIKILPVAWACITPEEFEEIKKKVKLPSLIKSNTDLRRHLTPEEVESNRTIEVLIPSAGCLLIKKEVFERVRYNLLNLQELGFTDNTIKTTDDIGFILDAEKNGFRSYCNTRIKCEHLVAEKYQKDEEGNFIHKGLKS